MNISQSKSSNVFIQSHASHGFSHFTQTINHSFLVKIILFEQPFYEKKGL